MYHARLVSHVNNKGWWHVPPLDAQAYSLRGKFYASSYRDAEFYGRPLDEPERVCVQNPLVGDEAAIVAELFASNAILSEVNGKEGAELIHARLDLDARMRDEAQARGYDAIVLMTPAAFRAYSLTGKIPRSLELNLLKN